MSKVVRQVIGIFEVCDKNYNIVADTFSNPSVSPQYRSSVQGTRL